MTQQVSEPRTASSMASEADWSHESTTSVFGRLVGDSVLHRDNNRTHTTYFPNYVRQALSEAITLQNSGHMVENCQREIARELE